MLESRQQIDLDGQLRENEKIIPFHLTQTGPLIRYSFTDPDEVLQLRLGENGSRLELATDDKADKISTEKLKEKVRGTGITYEDLTLEFLYWENARVLGDETIRTRSCWKLQVVATDRASQYWNVVIWVDKASGALMCMDGYDWDGKVAKRFEVVSAQKIDINSGRPFSNRTIRTDATCLGRRRLIADFSVFVTGSAMTTAMRRQKMQARARKPPKTSAAKTMMMRNGFQTSASLTAAMNKSRTGFVHRSLMS